MLRLVLTYHNRRHTLSDANPQLTIGRLPDNDLCIEYDVVSGHHGRILLRNGTFVFEDFNSTNGTCIRDRYGREIKVKGASMPLKGEGIIVFGENRDVSVTFSLETKPPGQRVEKRSPANSAIAFLKAGEFEKSFELFEKQITEKPDEPDAYYYAGFAASRLEELETAILRFEQYLLLRPKDDRVWMDLGKIYERAGRMKSALHCYRKVAGGERLREDAQIRLKEMARFQAVAPISAADKKTREVLGEELVAAVEMEPFQVTYNVAAHGRILNDILKALKTTWQNVGTALNFYPKQTVAVRLVRPLGSTAGRAGFQGITFRVDAEHIGEKLFVPVLVTHEYAHYAMGRLTGFARHVPWWLQEGFAQHMSQNLTPLRLTGIKTLAQNRRLIPLTALEKGLGNITDRELVNTAYLEAHSAVAFFVKRKGYEELRKLIAALKEKGSISVAFERTGQSYDRFEKEWADWLEQGAHNGEVKLTREVKRNNHELHK